MHLEPYEIEVSGIQAVFLDLNFTGKTKTKDNNSEPLQFMCSGKRSLGLVGQGGNWLKVNTEIRENGCKSKQEKAKVNGEQCYGGST